MQANFGSGLSPRKTCVTNELQQIARSDQSTKSDWRGKTEVGHCNRQHASRNSNKNLSFRRTRIPSGRPISLKTQRRTVSDDDRDPPRSAAPGWFRGNAHGRTISGLNSLFPGKLQCRLQTRSDSTTPSLRKNLSAVVRLPPSYAECCLLWLSSSQRSEFGG